MCFQPFEHVAFFHGQFLDVWDGLGAEESVSDHDQVLADGAFRHRMLKEIILKFLFLHGKHIVLWIEEVTIICEEGMNSKRRVMFEKLGNDCADLLCWVK